MAYYGHNVICDVTEAACLGYLLAVPAGNTTGYQSQEKGNRLSSFLFVVVVVVVGGGGGFVCFVFRVCVCVCVCVCMCVCMRA